MEGTYMNSTMRNRVLLTLVFLLSSTVWASPAYKDGSYPSTVTENGQGTVSVLVTVKGGIIATIELPKGKGDLDMEDAALKDYLATLAVAPSIMEVDALSGATASCNLLKTAVFEALKAAAP